MMEIQALFDPAQGSGIGFSGLVFRAQRSGLCNLGINS